jgi:hypothetical protein
MYDEKDDKESEYYTIIELLESMGLGKAIAIILGFYTIVAGIVMVFVYWLTRHR